jgi:fumarate reductase subunit C
MSDRGRRRRLGEMPNAPANADMGGIASNVRLYVLQRATAALMAPMVFVHLVMIFYATGRGLSAAEILGRTRGSVAWGSFYAIFVLAASIHGAIGLRGILREWTALHGRRLDITIGMVFFVLAALGLRAVAAVVVP